LFLLALIAGAVLAPRFGDGWFSFAEKSASAFAKKKTLLLAVVALSAIVSRLALLSLFPVPLPEVHDEFSYLLAADTFAHGRLSNPPHPMSIFFETFQVIQHPTYASKYPPAQGAVLAVGQLLGHPWIGVLLSVAAMTAALTWMLQGWFPAPWALFGAVIVIARFDLFSYWINSYFGGAIVATGAALVLGALPRIVHHQLPRDSLWMGIGAALLMNSRPFEGFLFCLPVAIALLLWLGSRRSPGLAFTVPRVIFPAAAILAWTLLFVGYYNWRVTGRFLTFPETLAFRQYENIPLFAWQKLNPPLHYSNPQFENFFAHRLPSRYPSTWASWKHQSWLRVDAWWHFFLGVVLSLPFITLPWLVRDRRMRLPLIQLFLCAAGLLAVRFFEPHYAAPMTASLLLLLIQALRHLRQWKCYGRPVGIGLSRVVALAVLAGVPLFAVETLRSSPHDEPWNITRAHIETQLDAAPGLQFVIVRYTPQHIVDNEWVYNAADIDHSKVVWAREIPGQDLTPLLEYFRNRKVWLLEADQSPPTLRPYSMP
jgi:hypothetical protein